MIDVALCIHKLVPGAAYGGSLTEDTVRRFHGSDPAAAYRAVTWEDERPRPSWAEIEAVWPEVEAELAEQAKRPSLRERLANLEARMDALEAMVVP